MDIGELESKKLSELRDIGRDMKIPGYTTMKKQDLVFRIMQADAESSGYNFRGGVLEIVEDDKQTMGFLRSGDYLPGKDDIYAVSYTHLDVYKRQVGYRLAFLDSRGRHPQELSLIHI